MDAPATFGRRLSPPPGDDAPDPRLESLRAEAAAAAAAPNGFAAWRDGQRPRRLAMWMASLALTVAGGVGLAVDAPLPVSIAVGLGGLALGAWLRTERRRHLREIATWSEDAPI